MEEENIGVVGISYSIVLLHKYGAIKRGSGFYSTKYFKALFPGVEEHHIYRIRVFDRCLRQLGLITYEERGFIDSPNIQKTDLFDKLITVTVPERK